MIQKSTLPLKIKFFSSFLLGSLLFIFSANVLLAASQCSPITSPEYHSLRPYPGDVTCNPEMVNPSYLCGNTLVITEKFTGLPSTASSCVENKEAKTQTCSFVRQNTVNISVDTSNSELPIAGMTEGDLVTNSQKQTEKLEDPTKMSEYVSWYLNGITDRAEYDSVVDSQKVVDFSGPIKKLLPWLTQKEVRENVVDQAGNTRHNQIIGCIDGSGNPVACYPSRPGIREIRLTNWSGNLSSGYIPMSSAEDLKGTLSVGNPQKSGGDVTVLDQDIQFTGTNSATLYYSHMQEGSDLADVLLPTFVAQGLKNETGTGIQPPTSDSNCKILEVRSNKGDKLLGGKTLGYLTYKASFDCTFPTDSTPSACQKQVVFSSKIDVVVPKADDLWTKLVAGTASVVRRIFPKLGTPELGSAVDFPATSKTEYSSSANTTSPTSAEFYIPHLGGISEYFLKGIQTLLRPKGYGEPIVFAAGTSCTGDASIPKMVPAQGSCRLSKNNFNLPDNFVEILETAAETFKVPPSLILGVIYGEGGTERYQLTAENVEEWSKNCAKMPSCNSIGSQSKGLVPFFAIYWSDIAKAIEEKFPGRSPDPCNLFDAVLGTAYTLSKGASGGTVFQNKSCFGIKLNTGISQNTVNTCSWKPEDVETAIKTWESGYELNCFTKKGGCIKGNRASQCTEIGAPNIDICEKYNNYSTAASEISHNACVWNVYIKNK